MRPSGGSAFLLQRIEDHNAANGNREKLLQRLVYRTGQRSRATVAVIASNATYQLGSTQRSVLDVRSTLDIEY